MGEWMACGDLPSPYTGCPVPDVYIYVSNVINVWNTVSIFIHVSMMFLSTEISF